jgi:hypothetical protein
MIRRSFAIDAAARGNLASGGLADGWDQGDGIEISCPIASSGWSMPGDMTTVSFLIPKPFDDLQPLRHHGSDGRRLSDKQRMQA